MSSDDEYSLHHRFSDSITSRDINNVEDFIDFVKHWNKSFKNDGNSDVIKNVATVIDPNTAPGYTKTERKSLKVYWLYPFRKFEIRELLKHELAPLSWYLTKENKLRKLEKHNLANAIEVKCQVSPLNHVCIDIKKRDFVWFYGNVKKALADKLKTFGELVATLRKTFNLSKDSQHIDIVFNLYLENTIKYDESRWRLRPLLSKPTNHTTEFKTTN